MKLQNENIRIKMNFDVPDGYFDKLADNVMANIRIDESRRRRRRNIVIGICSAAASLCAIMLSGWFMTPSQGTEDVASNDYYQYYTDNIEATMSDYSLMEMLDCQDMYDNGLADSDYSDMIYDYYASPINIDNYFN